MVGTINITDNFLKIIFIIRKTILKINANIITRKIKIREKFLVSSNTKNGFFSQISKLKKKAVPKTKLFKNKLSLLKFFLCLLINKHINGKITNPSGKKK